MKKRVNLILESWLLQNWTVMYAKWSKVTLGQKIILSYRLLQFDHTTTCMHLNFLKCKQYIFAVIKKTKHNKISNITYICDCKHSGTSIMSRGNKNYKNLFFKISFPWMKGTMHFYVEVSINRHNRNYKKATFSLSFCFPAWFLIKCPGVTKTQKGLKSCRTWSIFTCYGFYMHNYDILRYSLFRINCFQVVLLKSKLFSKCPGVTKN